MLAPGFEREGLDLLTASASSCSHVSLSGTATDMPELLERFAGSTVIDTGRVTGRSLAMGGTAMAALLDFLPPGRSGLHLVASPDGPYFSIRFSGGPSV